MQPENAHEGQYRGSNTVALDQHHYRIFHTACAILAHRWLMRALGDNALYCSTRCITLFQLLLACVTLSTSISLEDKHLLISLQALPQLAEASDLMT